MEYLKLWCGYRRNQSRIWGSVKKKIQVLMWQGWEDYYNVLAYISFSTSQYLHHFILSLSVVAPLFFSSLRFLNGCIKNRGIVSNEGQNGIQDFFISQVSYGNTYYINLYRLEMPIINSFFLFPSSFASLFPSPSRNIKVVNSYFTEAVLPRWRVVAPCIWSGRYFTHSS